MPKTSQELAKREQLTEATPDVLPLSHIAIIMDGNRRWAESRHLPKMMGHKEGVKTLKKIVRHAGKRNLKFLTVYAFSSENWQRSQDEVDYLLELFANVLKGELDDLCKNNVRLRFLGKLSSMPPNLRKSMENRSNACTWISIFTRPSSTTCMPFRR
jgi:undecaprenyl diphosphate synthase